METLFIINLTSFINPFITLANNFLVASTYLVWKPADSRMNASLRDYVLKTFKIV